MNAAQRALFDGRKTRARLCWRCHGCGVVIEPFALAPSDNQLEDAPDRALCAIVVGASSVFVACHEAAEIAARANRPVAFEFNGQLVVVNAGDDPDRIARAWWERQYGESPEESAQRR